MKVMTRLIFLNEDDEKFFGEGPYRLLKKVEETGSLHASAFEIGMAYSKATKLLKNAEASLGFPLTVRRIGGKSGGGSELTEEAKSFMRRYELFREASIKYNAELYEKYFGENAWVEPEIGCVIMASGLGKRFGGDKLMAELGGKPIIQYIIEATEGIFSHRVVVTRNEKVKLWCEERHIPVVFHALPGRNDTVRLGLEAIEKAGASGVSGCVFCPADMPFVSRESLSNMLSLAKDKREGIIRLSYDGKASAPVLFWSDYFEELRNLPNGKGGSEIIKAAGDALSLVEVKDEFELWDIDTQEDFERIKEKMQKL